MARQEGCRLWAVGCSQNEESDPALATADRATGVSGSREIPRDHSLQPTALSASISATERDLVLAALRSENGNRSAMAKRLGISPRTLRYKLAKLREAGVEV